MPGATGCLQPVFSAWRRILRARLALGGLWHTVARHVGDGVSRLALGTAAPQLPPGGRNRQRDDGGHEKRVAQATMDHQVVAATRVEAERPQHRAGQDVEVRRHSGDDRRPGRPASEPLAEGQLGRRRPQQHVRDGVHSWPPLLAKGCFSRATGCLSTRVTVVRLRCGVT